MSHDLSKLQVYELAQDSGSTASLDLAVRAIAYADMSPTWTGPRSLYVSFDYGIATVPTFIRALFVSSNRDGTVGTIRPDCDVHTILGEAKIEGKVLRSFNERACDSVSGVIGRFVHTARVYETDSDRLDVRKILVMSPYGAPYMGDVCFEHADGRICRVTYTPGTSSSDSFSGAVDHPGCGISLTQIACTVGSSVWLGDRLYRRAGVMQVDVSKIID